MIVEEHPTDAQLTAFGLGKLDDAEFTAIEAHVAECETCRRQLETQAADSFVALARAVRLDHTSADAGARPAAPFAPTCALTDSAVPASTEVPHELADHPRYRILGLIGVGGMGAVFKAEHLLMHRVVALKVINRRLVANPAMVERFTREVIAAGNLSHPNIVHYHDAEHIGDTHFLVMEHVEGTNLAKLMAETGPLPIAQACDYARQAALGLQHAFERGMVHRDIKPQNLMVTGVRSPEAGVRSQESGRPVLKILDFGLARLAQETAPTPVEPAADTLADQGKDTPSGTLTQIGTVMGTPDYIAPEQARDAHVADIRSDIYSLGCTLYDLLAGKPPFPSGTVMQKVIAHLEQTPRPLTELRPDVSAELAHVVEKMLAKDPAQRYQTPAEVATALAPFVSEPERQRRASPSLAIISGLYRRHRPFVYASLAIIVLALLAVFFKQSILDFAQTGIRIATNKGVLEIEADEEVHITVKQAGKIAVAEILNRKDMKSYELTAVDGEIEAKLPDGSRLKTTHFKLARGGIQMFSAKMLLATPGAGPKTEPAFQPLFNGKDLTGWKLNEGKWTVKDGAILADCAGELVSERAMSKNFRLRMEIKLRRGTGVVRFRVPAVGEREWSVALMDNRLGKMDGELHTGREIGQKSTGLVKSIADMDEWMVLEIAAQDQEATVRINGKQVMYLHNAKYTPAPGHIGLRIVGTADPENTEMQVRKIEIMEMPPGPPPPEPAFQPLFNGKNLDGWVPRITAKDAGPFQRVRFTEWVAENGVVLTPLAATGYLLTDQDYWDYEVQLEYKLMDNKSPAGLELAIHKGWKDKLQKSGREVLLQIDQAGKGKLVLEVDGDVSRSQMLGAPAKVNPLRFWNKLKIVSNGEAVQVWLNDHFLGQMTNTGLKNGLIALKGNRNDIYFRNIEIRNLDAAPRLPQPAPTFQPLFNGKNLTGWTGASDSYFVKKDGSLQANSVANEFAMLHTIKSYENYELRMLCKVAGAGQAFAKNRGGVAVHVTHPEGHSNPAYSVGISLISGRDPDMKAHGSGDIGDVNSSQATKGPIGGPGSWNELRVVCQDKKVTVYYNGEERWSCTLAPVSKGQIGLWSLDGETYFRDIEIRELPTRESAFRTLFDGKDVSAWDMRLANNWKFDDNRLICRGAGGILRPKKLDLREFHLRIEARHFGEGAYLRLGPQLFQMPDKKSVTAHQHVLLSPVLISAVGSIGMEFGQKELTGGVAQKDRTKPGEWYTLDVIHEGRYVHTLVNGEQAAEFAVTEPGALLGLGLLGFNQEDKNGEVQIRKIEIKDLSSDPKTAAKRLQGFWTPVEAIRGTRGKTAAFSKEDLKAFALEFDKDKLKCGLFPEATFQLHGDHITIKYRGPTQQRVSAEATYRLTHDMLALDFENIDLPFGPAVPKDKDGRTPLHLAFFRYHTELVPLFNGKNLQGFVNDRGNWTWQDDALVGVRRANDGQEDLLFRPSMPNLRDFELEFQVRTQGQAPVGIMFRGGENKENVGLLDSGPMLSIGGDTPGGLWNRNRDQLWRVPPAEKIKAVKPDAFNHYVLRCVGNRVTVQIDGVTMIDDDLDVPKMQPAGKLAWALLDNGKAGTVTFREIRLRVLPSPQ